MQPQSITKVCTACGVEQDASSFGAGKKVCRPCLRRYHNAYYHRTKVLAPPRDLTICGKCGVAPRVAKYGYCRECKNAVSREESQRNRHKRSVTTVAWKRANPERSRSSNNRSRERIKAELLALFGGKCCRCGFSDPRALQLDHIDGPGEDRRSLYRGGSRLYAAILRGERDPSLFQLLCANCNWIKRHEQNEHNRRWWERVKGG